MAATWEGELGGPSGDIIWPFKFPGNDCQVNLMPGGTKMESWREEENHGGKRLCLSGLARFGSVLVVSSRKVSIWCGRDVTFQNK